MGFFEDGFADSNGTELSAHTPDVGAGWTRHGSYTDTTLEIQDNQCRCSASGSQATLYYADDDPSSAEYDVEAEIIAGDDSPTDRNPHLCGRIATGADTFYRFEVTGSDYALVKKISGSSTLLDSSAESWSAGSLGTFRLELRDAAKKVYQDDVEILSSADDAITAAGKAGLHLRGQFSGDWRIDNFIATDASAGTTVTPNPLTQAQSLAAASLTQHYGIVPAGLDQAQTTEQAALTQHHTIAPSPLDQAQSLEQVVLAAGWSLTVAALQQAQGLAEAVLTQHHGIAPAALDQAQTLGQAALTQHHAVAPLPLAQAQSLEQVTLTVAGTLALDDLAQAQSSEVVVLVQHHAIAPAPLDQAQSLDAANLAAIYSLMADPLSQAQGVEDVALSLGGEAVIVAGLSQAQALEPSTLTEHAVLVVDDMVQQQLLDGAQFLTAVGWLRGKVVIVAALDGDVTITPALDGDVTIN